MNGVLRRLPESLEEVCIKLSHALGGLRDKVV